MLFFQSTPVGSIHTGEGAAVSPGRAVEEDRKRHISQPNKQHMAMVRMKLFCDNLNMLN